MKEEQLSTFIVSMIELIGSILMMIFYCRRVYKLSILASNMVIKKQSAMVFKIFLILSYFILQVIDIILSYTVTNYWFFDDKWLTLIDIAPALNMGMQILIITRQYKKKSPPILWHNVYWLFMIVINAFFIWIIFKYDQTPQFDCIIPVLNIVLLATLISFSFFVERKRFTNVSIEPPELPLIRFGEDSQEPQKDKILFEFNKQISLQVTKNSIVVYTFKIGVYIGKYSYMISKTDRDFETLESDLRKLYPISSQVRTNYQTQNKNRNWMQIGQQKAEVYESYLLRLAQSFYFYTQVLLDFLQIDDKLKQMLMRNNKRRPSIVSEGLIQNIQPVGRKFFIVKYSNNKISIDNPQILSLNIDKNIKQIESLHDRLISSNKLRSVILTNNSDQEILKFIDIVANSKSFWNQFSAWMDVPQNMRVHVFNLFDFWYQGFSQIKVDVRGHEISMDESGKTPTFYLFSITKSKGISIKKRLIKKRFRQFVTLNKQVKQYFKQKPNVKIPSLPPKVSAFGAKTSAKSRQIYLQTYLVQLLQIPEINYCIKVLEFLIAQQIETQTLFRSNSYNNQSKVTIDELKELQQQTPQIQDLYVSKII